MNKQELIDRVTNDIVAVISILAIAFLGVHGVIDPEVIGAIAGLGGYRIYRNGKKTKTS